MKILLIDDEQALLDVFTQTLKIAQFEVITASNGAQGLEKAKSEKPDAILLDQILPDMNGNQVLQMIKSDPQTSTIPVAILSNYNQDGMMQQAINLGATDYLLKYQIAPQDLIMKVQSMIPMSSKPPTNEQVSVADQSLQATHNPTSSVPPRPLEAAPISSRDTQVHEQIKNNQNIQQ